MRAFVWNEKRIVELINNRFSLCYVFFEKSRTDQRRLAVNKNGIIFIQMFQQLNALSVSARHFINFSRVMSRFVKDFSHFIRFKRNEIQKDAFGFENFLPEFDAAALSRRIAHLVWN